MIAFFVGSNTILPGLESFCIYAAVAIFAIYVMQVTHFVAWMSLGKNSHAFLRKFFRKVFFYFASWIPASCKIFLKYDRWYLYYYKLILNKSKLNILIKNYRYSAT